jgi:hypothetical protein
VIEIPNLGEKKKKKKKSFPKILQKKIVYGGRNLLTACKVQLMCGIEITHVPLARTPLSLSQVGVGSGRTDRVLGKTVIRLLIGSGRSGRLSGFGKWMSGGWSGLIELVSRLF